MANPFANEPVLMQTVATAVTALVASLGLSLDAATTAALTTGVTTIVAGFVRDKVTPEAHLPKAPAPPAAGPLGEAGAPLPPVVDAGRTRGPLG